MAVPALRLYPFGGVGEFGKNMMVYALDDEAIIVDCGIGFPEPGQHGIDVVIPDVSALSEIGLKVHAVVLTHGHEDHLGGLPFLLPELACPVYGTPITLGLLHSKMSEVPEYQAELRPLPEGGVTEVGPFGVEAIPVTHSIMDAVSLAIHTPHGIVVHTGDFKLDPAPIDGRTTALHRFAALGDKGVLLLASDSTNATRTGSGPAERSVGPALKQAILDCTGKVVITTFSSNMFRIQQIFDVAESCGRRVALAGRSLERNVEVTRNLGRLAIRPGQLVSLKDVAKLPDREQVVIVTGSQGETRAALARIARDEFSAFRLAEGDLVVFSSSMIPGNERAIAGLFNHIYRRGARVVHAGQAPLHVSGHAHAHELKMMLQLTRPRYFYPVHGEYRNLVEHKCLAVSMNVPEEHIVIAENGQSVEVDASSIRLGERFHAGAVFVDHANRDEVDDLVLRDRRVLAQEGIVTAIVVVERGEGRVLSKPELVTRGFVQAEVGAEMIEMAARELKQHLENAGQEFLADDDAAKEEIRLLLRRFFRRQTGKRPMVLPVVLEV